MTLVWNQSEVNHLLHAASGPLGKHLGSVGARVASAARGACPVGTPESTGKPGYHGGATRQSINWRLEEDGGELCAMVRAGTRYSRFVHDGTSRMQARPFLVDGLEAVTGSRGGWSPWSDK